MSPKSERGAGKELGRVQEVMYRCGQAGEVRVVGILRHERGGCKNEVRMRNGE